LLLGLEYTPNELAHGLRTHWSPGLVDLVVNFVPGFLVGLAIGWDVVPALLLGGVTYITSSGLVAKLLGDLGRVANRETPVVLSILVIEDMVMAVMLPILGVLVVGSGWVDGSLAVTLALAVLVVALAVSMRLGPHVSRAIDTNSAELLLLTVLGLTFLVAGLADKARVSAAVGAFLIGVMLSGQIAERGRELLTPIRDVFGGLFFLFFGLQIEPGAIRSVLLPIALLVVLTTCSKMATGWWAAWRAGIATRGRRRAAASLVPRGEFSIIIAGLGTAAGLEPELGAVTAGYVLVMAIIGSLLMRFADDLPIGQARPVSRAR
jgi:CPA2 family monovalent cation:H+ antiporter-2